jgi:hypothetical protein
MAENGLGQTHTSRVGNSHGNGYGGWDTAPMLAVKDVLLWHIRKLENMAENGLGQTHTPFDDEVSSRPSFRMCHSRTSLTE